MAQVGGQDPGRLGTMCVQVFFCSGMENPVRICENFQLLTIGSQNLLHTPETPCTHYWELHLLNDLYDCLTTTAESACIIVVE